MPTKPKPKPKPKKTGDTYKAGGYQPVTFSGTSKKGLGGSKVTNAEKRASKAGYVESKGGVWTSGSQGSTPLKKAENQLRSAQKLINKGAKVRNANFDSDAWYAGQRGLISKETGKVISYGKGLELGYVGDAKLAKLDAKTGYAAGSAKASSLAYTGSRESKAGFRASKGFTKGAQGVLTPQEKSGGFAPGGDKAVGDQVYAEADTATTSMLRSQGKAYAAGRQGYGGGKAGSTTTPKDEAPEETKPKKKKKGPKKVAKKKAPPKKKAPAKKKTPPKKKVGGYGK